MKWREMRTLRRLFGPAVMCLLALTSCIQPMSFKTLHGGSEIYPELVRGRPAILAFLNANDRRCDRVIRSLWSLSNRPTNPTKIVGVLSYQDFSFVHQIDSLEHATFPVLLDPERRLARRFWVKKFPTFVFLSWDGKELDRSADLPMLAEWIDTEHWHRRSVRPKKKEVPAIGKPTEKPPWS